ncbi:hypothetical protein [uncultured Parasutterella sp.]|jgi:hypothetical protein|uniref:hypothetical protein n=1 Tax=uncultured Parasutterella sp. TaxID=1263098 RepID=UPI0025DD3067|nr:hypothetical protein [uncultured Parasutterella sp.]
MAYRIDLVGQKFGFLTVIERYKGNTGGKNPRALWRCLCMCGNEVIKNTHQLKTYSKNGYAPSCGCQTKKLQRDSHVVHGQSGSPIYKAWTSMLSRCYLKSYHNYERYGGRGIEVCPRWKDSFISFYEDMAKTWKPGLSLDRIDNDKGYELSNCRWATKHEQNTNQGKSIKIDGVPLCELADQAGLKRATVYVRYYRGDRGKRLFRKPDIDRSKDGK